MDEGSTLANLPGGEPELVGFQMEMIKSGLERKTVKKLE